MGCGCKANKQITFLEKKYGENMPQSKTTNIGGKIVNGIKQIVTAIMLIPLFPIIGVFLIVKQLFSKQKTIDIKKTFKIAG